MLMGRRRYELPVVKSKSLLYIKTMLRYPHIHTSAFSTCWSRTSEDLGVVAGELGWSTRGERSLPSPRRPHHRWVSRISAITWLAFCNACTGTNSNKSSSPLLLYPLDETQIWEGLKDICWIYAKSDAPQRAQAKALASASARWTQDHSPGRLP